MFPHPASELTNGAMRRTNSEYFAFCSTHHIPDATDLVIIELDSDGEEVGALVNGVASGQTTEKDDLPQQGQLKRKRKKKKRKSDSEADPVEDVAEPVKEKKSKKDKKVKPDGVDASSQDAGDVGVAREKKKKDKKAMSS